jgi:hypothetical protein
MKDQESPKWGRKSTENVRIAVWDATNPAIHTLESHFSQDIVRVRFNICRPDMALHLAGACRDIYMT